ncbi:MAG: hypothetical protein ACXVPN_00390 [Bacteroidia bacterium]
MKATNIITGLLLIATLSLIVINCSNNSNDHKNNETTKADMCLAPASWFPHSQTPPPAEGAGSPFANPKATSNCDFHQWAWQKFLFLTHTTSANSTVLNFLAYKQVDNQMNLLGNTIILDDTTQAGSHSALFDKKNKSVYYAIFMNDEMYNFAKKYTDLFVFNCRNSDSSINQNQLNQLGYDTINYPVGSVEIKTSWVLTSSLETADVKNYFVTQGMLKATNKMVSIALVGMHVIGRVENHPEFIWATFEHNKLAPYAQWPVNFQNDSTPDPNQVLSNENSLFYKAGLILDSCSVRPYSPTQPNPTVNTFRSTYHLYQNGTQPQYKNMILRSQDSINQLNIQSINKSVLAQLSKEAGPWKNYEYIGAVWIDPTVAKLQPGNGNIGGLDQINLRGSRANTNITMETFAQLDWSYPNPTPPPTATDNGNTNPYNSMNCFGCHATANFQINGNTGANYNMALSHMFNNRLRMLLKKQGESGTLFLNHKKKK